MKFTFLARLMTAALLFVMGVSAYSSPPNKASPAFHENHELSLRSQSNMQQDMNTFIGGHRIRGHDPTGQSIQRLQFKESNIYFSKNYFHAEKHSVAMHGGLLVSNDMLAGTKNSFRILQLSAGKNTSSGTQEVAAATEIVYAFHNTGSREQGGYGLAEVYFPNLDGRRSVCSSCLSAKLS